MLVIKQQSDLQSLPWKTRSEQQRGWFPRHQSRQDHRPRELGSLQNPVGSVISLHLADYTVYYTAVTILV